MIRHVMGAPQSSGSGRNAQVQCICIEQIAASILNLAREFSDSPSVMFRFVEPRSDGLPQKRKQSNKACGSCRRRKVSTDAHRCDQKTNYCLSGAVIIQIRTAGAIKEIHHWYLNQHDVKSLMSRSSPSPLRQQLLKHIVQAPFRNRPFAHNRMHKCPRRLIGLEVPWRAVP